MTIYVTTWTIHQPLDEELAPNPILPTSSQVNKESQGYMWENWELINTTAICDGSTNKVLLYWTWKGRIN